MKGIKWLKGTTIINGYGPTESTTFACSYRISQKWQNSSASIPIGRSISNTEVYILNRRMELVPIGVVGELYIGGDGLAREYLGKAGLTAERFIPNPFCLTAGARLYKTGDLARYLAGGWIEFLGRRDNQVKIRGYRIELEEIEAVLERCAGVKQAAVVAKDEGEGGNKLIAYIVPDETTSREVSDIKMYLKNTLPEYMIPQVIVMMEGLPLTESGKIDRRALPAAKQTNTVALFTGRGPRTATEQLIASIWLEVLDIDQIGVDDNFFELGGHSILAMRAGNRLRQAFDIDIPMDYFFDSPTIVGLAKIVEELTAEDSVA
jgi:acyl-coenzyme A synthetase/AMP-(fatty) acid ligase/acyl carrier protein